MKKTLNTVIQIWTPLNVNPKAMMCYTAKFDALKSHVTCEISILANKLDSLLLVLHEALKTLEQHDVRNSSYRFHRTEILSKDEFITYLMEAQSAVLDVVTSVKNQEKTLLIQ